MNGKLLIVEDQTFFRKGLCKMIEDHPIGWTVVGEAENGREALDFIAQQPPDLVLTDIRMPGMDGIELAEHIHREQLDMDVVILTGYEDFKYAQAALRYGAIDFLLKPCNEETLIAVLQKAHEHFRARRQQKQQLQSAERMNQEGLLRAHILRLPHDAAAAASVVQECIGQQLLFVAVRSYFPEEKQYRARDLGLLQFALFNILSELLDGFGLQHRSIPLEYDRFAVLIDGGCPDEFKASAEQSVLAYLGIPITLTLQGMLQQPNDMPEAYDKLGDTFSRQTGAGHHPLEGPLSDLIGTLAQDNQSKVKELQVQLSADIALGQIGRLQEHLEVIARRIESMMPGDAKMEALGAALAVNASAKQSFDSRQEDAEFSGKLEQLQRAGTAEEAAGWLRTMVADFVQEYEEWKAGKSRNVIGKTLEYLDKHYMESCSLSEIADRFHLNSAYFSKLFKKETGDNFSAYLTNLRIQKAAMLLLNTEMKVFEIASAVGYDDPNYFTNVFRMIHHASPSDYRKQNRQPH